MSSRLSTMSPPSKPDQSLSWLANLHHIPATGLLSGDTLSPETLKIMQENKKLAARFRREKSYFCAWLPLVGFPSRSRSCSDLFMRALDTVESDPAVYQAGLIACIHLLHVPTARGLIRMLRPAPGHIFKEEHLILYLGTILMAHHASPSVCSREEASAAAVLLGAIQWRAATDSCPPIVRLLEALVDEACEDLLPMKLVEQILAAYHYPENISNHLETLRVECRWYEAHEMVKGLPAVLAIVELALISRANFPDHEMWAAWSPCQHRIDLWQSPHLEPHRFALRSLLKFEGPDPTGKYIYAPTLRAAQYGKHCSDVDAALRALDRCIAVGPESVASFAQLSPFTVRLVQESGGRPARSAPKKKVTVVKDREWEPSEDQMESGPSSAREEKETKEEVAPASKPCRDVGLFNPAFKTKEEADLVVREPWRFIHSKCPWAPSKYSASGWTDEELRGEWGVDEEERGRDAGRFYEFVEMEEDDPAEVVRQARRGKKRADIAFEKAAPSYKEVGEGCGADRKEQPATMRNRLALELEQEEKLRQFIIRAGGVFRGGKQVNRT